MTLEISGSCPRPTSQHQISFSSPTFKPSACLFWFRAASWALRCRDRSAGEKMRSDQLCCWMVGAMLAAAQISYFRQTSWWNSYFLIGSSTSGTGPGAFSYFSAGSQSSLWSRHPHQDTLFRVHRLPREGRHTKFNQEYVTSRQIWSHQTNRGAFLTFGASGPRLGVLYFFSCKANPERPSYPFSLSFSLSTSSLIAYLEFLLVACPQTHFVS